jgi:hypothetical protein
LDAQTIADTLESLSGDLEVKATNVAMFVRNLEAQAEAIKAAEKAMADRRKAIEARAESIREYLHSNMDRTGITKIECPYFVLSIKKNPAAVKITGEVPDEFLTTPKPPEPAPDKAKIKEFIQSGNSPDWAKLEQGTRLEIK